jgi:hypothetical protein
MVFLFLLGLIFPTLSSRPSIVLIISLAPFGFISAVAQW